MGIEKVGHNGAVFGRVTLHQKWELHGHQGIRTNPNGTVSLTAAKTYFLPPKNWNVIMIPYKAEIIGGATIANGLSRAGLLSTLTLTKSGEMYVNVFNAMDESIHLAAKTVVINIIGADVWLKPFNSRIRQLLPRKVKSASDEAKERYEASMREKTGMHQGDGTFTNQDGKKAESVEKSGSLEDVTVGGSRVLIFPSVGCGKGSKVGTNATGSNPSCRDNRNSGSNSKPVDNRRKRDKGLAAFEDRREQGPVIVRTMIEKAGTDVSHETNSEVRRACLESEEPMYQEKRESENILETKGSVMADGIAEPFL